MSWGKLVALYLGFVALASVGMVVAVRVWPPDPVTGGRDVTGLVVVLLTLAGGLVLGGALARLLIVPVPDVPPLRVEARVAIARPPAAVFAFLTDIRNDPRWSPGIVATAIDTPGPFDVGTAYRHTIRVGLVRVVARYAVTACAPPHQLAVTGDLAGRPFTGRYTLTPDGAGTVVILVAENAIDRRIMLRRRHFTALAERETRALLDRLRHALESTPDVS